MMTMAVSPMSGCLRRGGTCRLSAATGRRRWVKLVPPFCRSSGSIPVGRLSTPRAHESSAAWLGTTRQAVVEQERELCVAAADNGGAHSVVERRRWPAGLCQPPRARARARLDASRARQPREIHPAFGRVRQAGPRGWWLCRGGDGSGAAWGRRYVHACRTLAAPDSESGTRVSGGAGGGGGSHPPAAGGTAAAAANARATADDRAQACISEGLLCAYVLHGDGSGWRICSWEELTELSQRLNAAEPFTDGVDATTAGSDSRSERSAGEGSGHGGRQQLWVDLDYMHPQAREWLRAHSGIASLGMLENLMESTARVQLPRCDVGKSNTPGGHGMYLSLRGLLASEYIPRA